MDNVPHDLLSYFLTTYPTYRDQCTLSKVCKLWYKIIMSYSADWEGAMLDFRCAVRAREGLVVYRLLCLPVYRPIFIDIKYRRLRSAIIKESSSTNIERLILVAIDELCRIVDSDLIKQRNYWKLIENTDNNTNDLDYEQFAALFAS